ncbi:MAG: ATP synthase F1 subunit epsilon [Oscillospiraceae bacterium]|jgi:F-type H+-transporting ATPase subunit epsilon|nr:ATP synthase F1 subunit epsilon [Oscillospiraceae bacterium]
MGKLFDLKILTPEREFFSGSVEAITVSVYDGSMTVLADHIPLIAPLEISSLRLKMPDGEWREAFNSEGFMEVRREGVLLFVQTCEWPEEIDARRAEEARLRAEELLRQRHSMSEYQQSKIDLARAMERLRVTKSRRS